MTPTDATYQSIGRCQHGIQMHVVMSYARPTKQP